MILVSDNHRIGFVLDALLNQEINIVQGGEHLYFKEIRVLGNNFQCLGTYGSGGAKYGNSLLHGLKNDIIDRIKGDAIVPQLKMKMRPGGKLS